MSVPAAEITSIVDELRAFLPDRVSTAAAVREQHGHDESYHRTRPSRRRRLPREHRRGGADREPVRTASLSQ